jgi:hypothetical protein
MKIKKHNSHDLDKEKPATQRKVLHIDQGKTGKHKHRRQGVSLTGRMHPSVKVGKPDHARGSSKKENQAYATREDSKYVKR